MAGASRTGESSVPNHLTVPDPKRQRVNLPSETSFSTAGSASPAAGGTDLSAVQAQMVVFARELGELYSAERVRTRELEVALDGIREMYVSTMKSLAQVVEAKDSNTRGHLDRTQTYGLELARRIDPELAARPEVGYGFFLHDIGKVGIPERVLSK